ncbi:hypothetical protein PO883_06385 [Massilia sp. DJPM01]|uniref:hypothetical protein n=1 Tax=Massilia sp. DJPM01 TaxID=3024404 RepID=UPI00259E7E9B|nr:hypothetical protein [Massilia sp. DJPM01]MDM5176824.1 hypothetical protein [Massilia sp. DJPM01]
MMPVAAQLFALNRMRRGDGEFDALALTQPPQRLQEPSLSPQRLDEPPLCRSACISHRYRRSACMSAAVAAAPASAPPPVAAALATAIAIAAVLPLPAGAVHGQRPDTESFLPQAHIFKIFFGALGKKSYFSRP